ncbi:rhamnan synthesis F family protein [Hyphomicrobium facile]|uniref:Rhamnan synthesis protein F n=1 Tax=Hyphomicrobium facile TaxID=51670 RepID=A0A1I7MVT9_9HYPH|nr:rhamnan synthesis F family protein [Hyphomicrobium facile]SFV26509.1 Rhamnan synthesis protein F [Hyphomicrobium facile]
MRSQRIFETPTPIFQLAKYSRRAASLAIFLRAALRHPTNQQKRRLSFERVNAWVDDELPFEKWVHPQRTLQDDRCIRFPEDRPIDRDGLTRPLRVAVVCHLYYDDLVEEIRTRLAVIPTKFDLLVSTDTAEKKSRIEAALSSSTASNVVVREFPNVGRDIAPKLMAFNDKFDQYDVILFIHGKKSVFSPGLSEWRQYIFDTLIGTRDRTQSILSSFQDIPELGMIAPEHFAPVKGVGWRDNFKIADGLCSKLLGDKYAFNYFDFPCGSMFWCRPAALKPLLDLNLSVQEFPAEQGQVDGTLAHAIERFFFTSCELAGLRWLKMAADETKILPVEIVDVGSSAEVRQVLKRAGGRVLAPR